MKKGCCLLIVLFLLIPPVLLICLMFYEHESINTDLEWYPSARIGTGNAQQFLPTLEELGTDCKIDFTYKKTSYYIFTTYGIALFVQYDSEDYGEKKSETLGKYQFLDAPAVDFSGDIQLTESVDYRGFHFQIAPDPEYIYFQDTPEYREHHSCKSFVMIGTNDDTHTIAYLYFFDPDVDYIATEDEDPYAEMQSEIDFAFAWPE